MTRGESPLATPGLHRSGRIGRDAIKLPVRIRIKLGRRSLRTERPSIAAAKAEPSSVGALSGLEPTETPGGNLRKGSERIHPTLPLIIPRFSP